MSELFTTAKCWECKKNYIFGLCVFILLNITGICGIIALLNSQETPYTTDYNVVLVGKNLRKSKEGILFG